MAQANSEIRYLTPPSIELKKKKYCRFKKSGIKYIDYKDPEFLKKFLNEQGKILPRRLTGTSQKFQKKVAQAVKRARGSSRKTRTPFGTASLCNRLDEIIKEEKNNGSNTFRRHPRIRI